MKKIFSILAIAALVSCNNGGDASEVKPVDSSAVAPAKDSITVAIPDSVTVAIPDSAAAKK